MAGLASLTEDVLLKVLDLLETRERARLAMVSKEWHNIVTSTWTEIVLEPKGDEQIAAQLTWLGGVLRQNPASLHSLQILPAASGSNPLLPDSVIIQLASFSNLQSLTLWPPIMGSSWESQFRGTPYLPRISIEAEAVHHLSLLTSLHELSIAVSCPRRYLGNWSEASSNDPRNSLSLEPFAELPKLGHLQVTLHDARDRGQSQYTNWSVRMPWQGFDTLRSLCIEGAEEWAPDNMGALAKLVSRLTVLQLSNSKPLREVMDASRLTFLGYTAADFAKWQWDERDGRPKPFLPFGTAECLDKLICVGASQPQSLSELSFRIRELQLDWTPGRSTSQFIQLLKPLTSLSMLILDGYEAREEAILSPFTCLTSLVSLDLVDFKPSQDTHTLLSPEDGVLEYLTRLQLDLCCFSDPSSTYDLGAGLLHLTAIKLLRAKVGRIEGEISSNTLEELHCIDTREGANAIQSSSVSSVTGILGDLPRLRVLCLTSSSDSYYTKDAFGRGLAGLSSLEGLTIRCSAQQHTRVHAHDSANGWVNGITSNAIQIILRGLQGAKHLKFLRLELLNSRLNLSWLKSFQNIAYLSISCWTLENDDSFVPLLNATLDIHFLEAPESLLEQIRSPQDAELTATATPHWKHYHSISSDSTQQSPNDCICPFSPGDHRLMWWSAEFQQLCRCASDFWSGLVTHLQSRECDHMYQRISA